jgi:hypothetical protein
MIIKANVLCKIQKYVFGGKRTPFHVYLVTLSKPINSKSK